MPMESRFQSKVIRDIQKRWPGAIVLKNDPNYQQGFPDWLILNGRYWGALEIKGSANARRQRNQEYWVETCNFMSFGRFIFPENEEEVLHDLQRSLHLEE